MAVEPAVSAAGVRHCRRGGVPVVIGDPRDIRLDPALVRVGLLTPASAASGDETATFDRFVVE